MVRAYWLIGVLILLLAASACGPQTAPAVPTTPPAASPTAAVPTQPPVVLPTAAPTNTAAPPVVTTTQPALVASATSAPVLNTPSGPISATMQPTQAPPQPTVAVGQGKPYAVVNVFEGDTLNVRGAPNAAAPVLATLAPDARGFQSTGRSQMVNGVPWLELTLPDQKTGWANAAFLTEVVDPAAFCSDSRVPALLDQFTAAIQAKDGKALSALVSPLHGLTVEYIRGGNPAQYSREEARWLFESTYQMNWGPHPGSGEDVVGPFHEEVLPQLLDVTSRSPERLCNEVKTGGASYDTSWPEIWKAVNFYSLHRPGPADQELDWRTWLVGIEMVDGKPYLFSLLHMAWEP